MLTTVHVSIITDIYKYIEQFECGDICFGEPEIMNPIWRSISVGMSHIEPAIRKEMVC